MDLIARVRLLRVHVMEVVSIFAAIAVPVNERNIVIDFFVRPAWNTTNANT